VTSNAHILLGSSTKLALRAIAPQIKSTL